MAQQEQRQIILDHDGHVDDLLALTLLACVKGASLKAVTVSPADSYRQSAMDASKKFLDYLGVSGVFIAGGNNKGINPFPEAWRRDSLALPKLVVFKESPPNPKNRVLSESAAQFLARMLDKSQRAVIVETGPLTNIAAALRLNPSIARNIERIWVMGGAVRVPGNVEQAGHDGSAEWNFFNNPAAASQVIKSGIPITLVGLDVTNKVPLNHAFLARLKGQEAFRVSRLALEAWRVAGAYIENPDYHNQYYFWDTLTAASMLEPGLIKTEKMKVKVVVDGASQGRTKETPDGNLVDVGVDVAPKRLEEFILEHLRK